MSDKMSMVSQMQMMAKLPEIVAKIKEGIDAVDWLTKSIDANADDPSACEVEVVHDANKRVKEIMTELKALAPAL